jgi:hypothetical protein
MTDQIASWYVRGKDNQPAGPFTAEELIKRLQVGKLDARTVCWREGMSQWLPLKRVEPFASAVGSVVHRPQSPAGASSPSMKTPTSFPSSLLTGTWAKIAMIVGGVVALCAMFGAAALLVYKGHLFTSGVSGANVEILPSEQSPPSDGRPFVRASRRQTPPGTSLSPRTRRRRQGASRQGISPASSTEPEVDLKTPDGKWAYALKLYDEGVRTRASRLMKELMTSHPDSPAAAKAQVLLAAPKPGRKLFDLSPVYFTADPFRGGGRLTIRLTDAEIRSKDFSLNFQVRASDERGLTFLWPTASNKARFQSNWEALYVIDDNGTKLYAHPPGFVTAHALRSGQNPVNKVELSPGEEATLSVTFPMISEGASSISFYSNALNGWQSAWSWKSIELKGGSREPLSSETTKATPKGDDTSAIEGRPGRGASPGADQRPQPKGPLSGIWRDKKGGNGFRIEDDDKALGIQLSGYNAAVRRFEGKLARRDGKPDSFEGTVEATFVHNPRGYSHRVTATLNKSGQLEMTCPEWPDPYGRSKPKTRTAILIRQGDLPTQRFPFPTSAPSGPNKTRPNRGP